MIRFVIGILAGVGIVYWLATRTSATGQATHAAGSRRSFLRGKIVPGPVLGSPAPDGLAPTGGYATRDGYEWAYVLGEGDTDGEIARAITGDDGRYQELLLANPEIKLEGEPGVYLGPNALRHADGEFYAGRPLLLPVPWSRYIDQLGTPRGQMGAFPPDPRVKIAVSGEAIAGEFDYVPGTRAARQIDAGDDVEAASVELAEAA